MTRSVELQERRAGEPLPSPEWWAAWRAAVGDDLLGGYATLCDGRAISERTAGGDQPCAVVQPTVNPDVTSEER